MQTLIAMVRVVMATRIVTVMEIGTIHWLDRHMHLSCNQSQLTSPKLSNNEPYFVASGATPETLIQQENMKRKGIALPGQWGEKSASPNMEAGLGRMAMRNNRSQSHNLEQKRASP